MKKFKKIIRAVLVLAVLAGLIYLIPKVITVVRLKRAADSYVAASAVSTFKDSKTTIIYDTNDQELCTMKNTCIMCRIRRCRRHWLIPLLSWKTASFINIPVMISRQFCVPL